MRILRTHWVFQDKDLSIEKNYVNMKLRDIIIAIIALILAYIVFGIIWTLTFFIIRIAVILVIAYIVYLFLKKIL
jgi:putative flippase GtrA